MVLTRHPTVIWYSHAAIFVKVRIVLRTKQGQAEGPNEHLSGWRFVARRGTRNDRTPIRYSPRFYSADGARVCTSQIGLGRPGCRRLAPRPTLDERSVSGRSSHLRTHRHVAQTLARRGENGIGERGRERWQARLSYAAGVRAGRRLDDVHRYLLRVVAHRGDVEV